jgi:hypothetical protein
VAPSQPGQKPCRDHFNAEWFVERQRKAEDESLAPILAWSGLVPPLPLRQGAGGNGLCPLAAVRIAQHSGGLAGYLAACDFTLAQLPHPISFVSTQPNPHCEKKSATNSCSFRKAL